MSGDRLPCTIEIQPPNEHFPSWLTQAFLEGKANALLILYPNEEARKQALNLLSGHDLAVDTTHHLTLPRLVDLLHLDLKLPRKLEAGPALFNVVHELTKQAAIKGELPLLFAPTSESRTWRPYNTERLTALHTALMDLDHPWRWDGDPGAREFHKILQDVGKRLEGTHPSLIQKNLTKALESSTTPFTLNDVEGVLLLDAAPDYTESEASLLRALMLHRPIHHLCNPGSFRLGFHGAYIDDVPYVTQETLPEWMPHHTVVSDADVEAGDGPEIRRIQLHQREHALDATLELIRSYRTSENGTIMIVDGQAKGREGLWRARLSEIGIDIAHSPDPLSSVPGINHLLRLMRIGVGNNAWSMSHLQSLTSHQSIALVNGGVAPAVHPTHDTWSPRPHIEVLEGMARSFHVRGGPGALTRWIRTLATAKPQLGRDSDEARQALEETQWWLACVARIWAPFVDGEEQRVLSERVEGCITQATLPLPQPLGTGGSWLNHILSNLDWNALLQRTGAYDRTVSALQLLATAHAASDGLLQKAGITIPSTGLDFIEHLERLVSETKMPSGRASSTDVKVLTPEDAHGVTADLVLLVGMDVDSWSMKLPKVPWLDPPTKLKLGMLHTDLVVRKGRHHLLHLLGAGTTIVLFDSTLEEGGGPAAPLSEWMSDAQRSGTYDALQGIPSFLPEASVTGQHPSRCWQFDPTTPDQNWLSPRPFTMEAVGGAVAGYRSGHRNRDARQRLGLALREGRIGEGQVNAVHGIAMAYEAPITNDRIQRQPTFKDLEKGDYMLWDTQNALATTDLLSLTPTFAQAKVGSRSQPQWPHLGMKKNGITRGVSIDPRPLPPAQFEGTVVSEIFGQTAVPIRRNVWSASRLQPWLACPRQAWMTGHLKAQGAEEELEDIDHRTRGQIIHDAEAAMLGAHGIPIGGEASEAATPLHLGPCPTDQDGWQTILVHLEENVPWLSRNDAIATHRCRDLIGVTPSVWKAHLDGEQSIAPGGRLWRMVQADYQLEHAAPIACEWSVAETGAFSIELDASNDEDQPAPFNIRGNVDRVDTIHLSEDAHAAAFQAGLLSDANHDGPLEFRNPSASGGARRWVIIRDLKTVSGPKKGKSGLRHLKALFDEIQLAMYARAWELAHPGDRVVGVGVMEVGETSTHYVELDPEIEPYLQGLSLGERTDVLRDQYRFIDDESYESNGFRAWMYQRLQTGRRAVDVAGSGLVHPTPSAGCSFCDVRSVCPSSIHGGERR